MNIKVRRVSGIHAVRGMIFSNDVFPLYFTTRWGIHTCLLKNSIVVCILDDDFCVRVKKEVPPWRLLFWNPRYSNVLELPHNYEGKNQIKVGSNITVEEIPA